MAKWVGYKNGNYNVHIDLETGTKVRENNLDFFECDTVESMDVKITNCCDVGCAMCHENSTPDGKHADILSPSFLDKLHPYCELAIGGGNPLEHPDLLKFLEKCKERKHIPSMTVNQVHFEKNFEYVKNLCENKLIYGLGISLQKVTDSFIEKVKQIPTAVIHVINGIVTKEQLEALANNNIKVLVLGYKVFRRGEKLYETASESIEKKKSMLKELLPNIIKEGWFKVISFDNLALKQLDVRSHMTEEEWNRFYMGADSEEEDYNNMSATFFVDLVERKFAINSCSNNRYDLKDTAEEMLKFLYEKLHK